MQSGQNQCAHCMPMIVGGPGVDKPALGGGEHLFNEHIWRFCFTPSKPTALTGRPCPAGDPVRAGETGLLTQPNPGERWGPTTALGERRHSLLRSAITRKG